MIIMEELDISPSEFTERFMSEEISLWDADIKSIALRCYDSNKWVFTVTNGNNTITPYWIVNC
jgi:hypothetical protein